MPPRKSTTKVKDAQEATKAVKMPSPSRGKQGSTDKKTAESTTTKARSKTEDSLKPAPKPARKPTPAVKATNRPQPVKAEKKIIEVITTTKTTKLASRTKARREPEPEVITQAPHAPMASGPCQMPAPRELKGTGVITPHTHMILTAIREGRAVELIFRDGDGNPPRTFEPRQLIFDTFTQAWFVWGWDRRYNAERHHRVDLFAEVNIVEGVGRAAQGPFKEGTPANHIGGWLGGEPIPVKVMLMKQWIYAVKQAPAPFPEFKIEDVEEGKAQVTFTATDLRAIARWCMQFGEGIQVLEPQRLQDRIKQVGLAWGGKATQAPPQPTTRQEQQPRQEPRTPIRQEPRQESRHEGRHERNPEPRIEAQPEPKPEPRRELPPEKVDRSKSGKVEVRIERL